MPVMDGNILEMKYCTNCGSGTPTTNSSLCGKCASIRENQKTEDHVTGNLTSNVSHTDTIFLDNARVGMNRWWRWVLGPILILVIWQGIGVIPYFVACEYLKAAYIRQFTCDGLSITGDSLIPGYILANYSFIIGIIGIWITVKLIHKKTLRQVVTGRVTFDYSRVLCAIGIGALIPISFLALDRLFFHSEITFRSPNPWEYVTFLLFAIVLTPYQAGFEEVFFRGYLVQGVSLLTRNRFVLVATSCVLFMVPHLLNPEPYEYGFGPYVSSMLIFGAFVSLFTLLDGGIELAVGYHAINNLWLALIANTEITPMPTPSLFVISIDRFAFFPDVIVQLISSTVLLAIFNWKYRWFSWATHWKDFSGLKIG